MPAPTQVDSLDLARRRAMVRFEEGELPEADSELTQLLDSPTLGADPRSNQLRYYLYQDRATVRRSANRWEEALADLSAAEDLISGMSPLMQPTCRSAVAHARALILSEPANPRANVAEAGIQILILRSLGQLGFAVDDLEARQAHRAKDWARAARLARRAAAALDAQGWPAAAASCRLRAADALLGSGDLTGAEAELATARRQVDRFGTPNDLARAALVEAKLLSARGEHDAAWDSAVRALDQFDGLIRRFSALSEQQRFLVDKLDRYAEAFAIALDAGGERGCVRGWSVAERSKSFYLCQLLASANVSLFEGVDAAELVALRQAGEELDRLERKLGSMTQAAREGEAGREIVARQRETSLRKADALRHLMQSNPRWARVNVPAGLDMTEQIRLLPEGWSFLSYYWDSGASVGAGASDAARLHVFWTDAQRRPRHLTTDWSHEDLRGLRDCRARLRGEVPFGAPLIPRMLSDLILPAEVCQSIRDDSRVVISPHGLLQLLPIHAMEVGAGDYVAGRWAVQYLPTLALLPLARPSASKDGVLLIGCAQDGFGDGPLTDVPGELNALSELWSAEPARSVVCRLIPQDGSPDGAGVGVGTWGEFGILHAACHGDFRAESPFDAGLRLGSASIRTSDFFGVRLDGAVATLSACSLGRHAEDLDAHAVAGDEWIGLCLPLLYAGVRCVVSSLWDAYSEPAARFMGFLHIALKRGDDPADAVRWAEDRTAGAEGEELPPAAWANWYAVGLPVGRADAR